MKNPQKWASYLLVMALVTGISGGMFYSKGPPPGATNAPTEVSCHAGRCHAQYPINSGPGSLQLTGIPTVYQPHEKYTLSISLTQEGQARWGFQITVLDQNHQAAGDLIPLDKKLTQLKTELMPNESKRTYIEHTADGTYPGMKNGPVTWEIIWTAPGGDIGPVYFYTAANAADFNKQPRGDYIYTRIDTAFGAHLD